MLIQISENTAAVTPYGSLAHVYQNVGVEHGTVQSYSIGLVWRRILKFIFAVSQDTNQKTLAGGTTKPRSVGAGG
jgi:hypothetical protein